MNNLRYVELDEKKVSSWSFLKRVRNTAKLLKSGEFSRIDTKGFKGQTLYNSVSKVKKELGIELTVRTEKNGRLKCVYLVRLS